MSKVLVTGATGFIGKRLIFQLLEKGHEVFALIRSKGRDLGISDPNLHFVYGDISDITNIEPFPKQLDAAFYFVHSMGNVVQNLIEMEVGVASNFVSLIEKTECKQIIYLGGIIENEEKLSPHLVSRLAVEKVLQTCNMPCTILRSSIIIGSGSASFEIIRDLVEKLPIMVAPRWIKSRCQPIAIRDVLYYLEAVMLNPDCYGQTLDIAGPEPITFKETMLRYAAFRKLKRFIINVPVLTPRLSSYWLVFITSVKFSICKHLVESMKQDSRKLNTTIDELLPHSCLTYEQALEIAFQKIAQNQVVSTWMDAWEGAQIEKYIEVPKEGCLKDIQTVPIHNSIDDVQKKIWSIGGERGWYSMNWAWKLRGLMDKLIGGIGFNRGRRHPTEMQTGDSIDFWRVLLADAKKRHLILYAEMKLPGEAWLEFEILEEENLLKQTASFRPKGVLGRLYWYLFFPFHYLIFKNMAKALAHG